MKEKLKLISAHILRIAKTPAFNICVGVLVVIMSLYDITEDLSKIRKEHLTLIIGILMIIDSIHSMIGGTQKILIIESNVEVITITMRIKKIMKSPAYYIFIGLIIVITSAYDIYEDFFKIRKEHLALVLGIIYILLALKKGYEGGEKVYTAIEKELPQVKL